MIRAGLALWAALGMALAALPGCVSSTAAELDAYLASASNAYAATDAVLDIVAPYERIALLHDGDCDPRENVALTPLKAGFCHAQRDAHAAIGDPPVVGAVRALSDAVARFDRIVVAYANGVSLTLLRQDLGALSTLVGAFGPLLPEAAGAAKALGEAATDLAGLSGAGALADRPALGAFVKANAPKAGAALAAVAQSSDTLFGNVSRGTQVLDAEAFAARPRRIELSEALMARRAAIAGLLADWTVLVDRQRALLDAYAAALADPQGLETRLANLGERTRQVDADAAAVLQRAAGLGVDPPRP